MSTASPTLQRALRTVFSDVRRERYSLPNRISTAAADTDRNPTDEQKRAGNYRKGRFWMWGLELVIENPKGSVRSGRDSQGRAWSVTMPAHYGYIRRTLSEADGDHVDCFIGPHPTSEVVFVVNQQTPGGRFDEHKVVLGCRSKGEARKLYLSAYSAGWKGLRSLVAMTRGQFLKWVHQDGATKKPAVERYAAEFDESKHPRDDTGRFVEQGITHRQFKGSEPVPVSVADDAEITSKADAIKRGLTLRGSFENKSTDWTIHVYADSIRHSIQRHGLDFRAITALPQLAENAILFASEPNRDSKKSFDRVHHFYSPLRIGDEMYLARLTVVEKQSDFEVSDQRLYHLASHKSEKLASERAGASTTEVASAVSRAGKPDMNIGQLIAAVKEKHPDHVHPELLEKYAQKHKPDSDQKSFRWVTIGGHEEDGKQHAGGTPVLLDGEGRIASHPTVPALHGKKPHEVGKKQSAKKGSGEVATSRSKSPEQATGQPSLTDEKLFERSGQAFENLQIAMGIRTPVMGAQGAQQIRAFISKHPGGRVIAAALSVDGSQSGYDRNGFAERGQDAYREIIDGKFTKAELDAAAKWFEDEFDNSKSELANVNQYRWIAGTIKTAQPTVPGQQQNLFNPESQGKLFNVSAPKPSPKSADSAAPKSELEKIADADKERSEANKPLDGQRELADVGDDRPKEAWESMTAEEAEKLHRLDKRRLAYDAAQQAVSDWAKADRPRHLQGYLTREHKAELIQQGVTLRDYQARAVEEQLGQHRNHVEGYLARGINVPSDVLQEYPDLVAKHAGATDESDRNSFSTGGLRNESFNRGDWVRASFNDGHRSMHGYVEGVSHARKQVKVGGVWHPFGAIYKPEQPSPAELDEAERKANSEPISKAIERVNKTADPDGILTDADRVPEHMQSAKPERKAAKADPIKAAERALAGRKIDGFFPTPKTLANRLVDEADIRPGMKVLEPSAGKGDLLDVLRERHGDAIEPHAIEPHSDLRGVLDAKGHKLVGDDFLKHSEGSYDRIVMNPPFENSQDIEHVKHAYSLLAPGGRVVAIMSAGSGRKREEFDAWLNQQGGVSEDLPEGSFASNEAFRKTGVNTRMVTLEKPSTPDDVSREPYRMLRRAFDAVHVERYELKSMPAAERVAKQPRKRARAHKSARKRQPGDGTPGWQKVGGSSVFVNGDGKITKGCPGLKGEHVNDLIGEDDLSRDRRAARQAHAEASGKTGKDFKVADLKKLESPAAQQKHAAARSAAKATGVATKHVLRAMDDEHKRAAQEHFEFEKARARARQITGLNSGRQGFIENAYRDHSSVPGFDEAARSFAYEFQHLGFDPDDTENPQKVWDFIREGAKPAPKEWSQDVADSAADRLATDRKAARRAKNAPTSLADNESGFDEWGSNSDAFHSSLVESLADRLAGVPF